VTTGPNTSAARSQPSGDVGDHGRLVEESRPDIPSTVRILAPRPVPVDEAFTFSRCLAETSGPTSTAASEMSADLDRLEAGTRADREVV